MNQQLPQFIDHVVDRLQAVEGITAISRAAYAVVMGPI